MSRTVSLSSLAAVALTALVAGCGSSGSGDSANSGASTSAQMATFITAADQLCQADVDARKRTSQKIVDLQKDTNPSAGVAEFSEKIKLVANYNEQLVMGKTSTLEQIKALPQPDNAKLKAYYAQRAKVAAAWNAQTEAQVGVTTASGVKEKKAANEAIATNAKVLATAIGENLNLAKAVGFNVCSVK